VDCTLFYTGVVQVKQDGCLKLQEFYATETRIACDYKKAIAPHKESVAIDLYV